MAILCNHDNDGKLSFRDYMKCMAYEIKKDQHNYAVEEAQEWEAPVVEIGSRLQQGS